MPDPINAPNSIDGRFFSRFLRGRSRSHPTRTLTTKQRHYSSEPTFQELRLHFTCAPPGNFIPRLHVQRDIRESSSSQYWVGSWMLTGSLSKTANCCNISVVRRTVAVGVAEGATPSLPPSLAIQSLYICPSFPMGWRGRITWRRIVVLYVRFHFVGRRCIREFLELWSFNKASWRVHVWNCRLSQRISIPVTQKLTQR